MALEPYARRVALEDMPGFRVSTPEVADPGNAFRGVGRSLLNAAEPILQDEAQREAIKAAGVADIAKDEAGNFIRPPAPPGGGLVYRASYDKAMNARYSSQVVKAGEDVFAVYGREHRDDPEAYKAAMVGYVEGVLKGVDPTVRAEVEIDLTREVSERYRGASQLKAARDEQATVNGWQLEYRQRMEAATKIFEVGGPDAPARAQVEFDAANVAVAELQKLGEISPQGAGAMMRAAQGDFAEGQAAFKSQQFIGTLGQVLPQMDDTELQRMTYWGIGLDDGGTVQGMDFKTFMEQAPDKTARALIGRMTGNVLADRIAAANAQAQADRDAALQNTTEKVITAIKDANRNPVMGYSDEEVAAVEADYNSRGLAHVQMQSAEGRVSTLKDIATAGFMPIGVVEYIEGQINGNEVANVAQFVQDLQLIRTKGVWVGQRVYEQLSPETRATIEFDETMRRAGLPPSVRRANLEAARRGDLPKPDEVQAAYKPQRPGDPGYAEQRTAAIAKALGLTPAQAQAAIVPGRDFDAMLRVNFQLYAGNPTKAMEATAKSISGGWIKNASFVGGIGPKDLVTAGFTHGELNLALLSDRSKNPTGATIQGGPGGYARLRPISDNPAKGFGIYEVQLFTPSGRPIGSYPVDMDKAMGPAQAAAARRREAATQANIAKAQAGGPAWVVSRDARGGVQYIPNPNRKDLPQRPKPTRTTPFGQ